ncbi:MAG: hypothetical protein IKV03_03080 [Alphaproteobacteria bacterium]|nr:hypothetical protein [Alphaproteobacteria bacterium]
MVQHLIEEETKYNILKNISGDVMILIRARIDDAVNPQIVYNGKEHALLYRSQNNTIVLGYIHPDIRTDLALASSVLIVEAQGSSIVREYYASIKVMSDIPLPEKYQTAI